MTVETGTILDQIIARTRSDVTIRQQQIPRVALEDAASKRTGIQSFENALRAPGLSVIAEIKRGSPSKGMFPVEFTIEEVAGHYIDGGASAISVLTDNPFFHGSLEDLSITSQTARAWSQVPVLRKDFIVDEYQIVESVVHGADAILLIVGALEQRMLAELLSFANLNGLDALVEVHDELELDRALQAGATVLGVNNRDLRTFDVDLAVSERIAALVDDDVVLVGESGIGEPEDAQRMFDAGMDAILVGESLIVAPDRVTALRSLASIGMTQ